MVKCSAPDCIPARSLSRLMARRQDWPWWAVIFVKWLEIDRCPTVTLHTVIVQWKLYLMYMCPCLLQTRNVPIRFQWTIWIVWRLCMRKVVMAPKGGYLVVVWMCELWTSIVYNLLNRFLWKCTLFFCSYSYSWKLEEAQKNLLRTHTTAVSARMLYKLAQQVVFFCHTYNWQLIMTWAWSFPICCCCTL